MGQDKNGCGKLDVREFYVREINQNLHDTLLGVLGILSSWKDLSSLFFWKKLFGFFLVKKLFAPSPFFSKKVLTSIFFQTSLFPLFFLQKNS